MARVVPILANAFMQLAPSAAPVLHSDQGLQYQMRLIRTGSGRQVWCISRKSDCLDKAMAVYFFRCAQIRMLQSGRIQPQPALRNAVEAYITTTIMNVSVCASMASSWLISDACIG